MNNQLLEDSAQLLAAIAMTSHSLAGWVSGRTAIGDLPESYFETMDNLFRISEFLVGPLSLPLAAEATR